MADRLLRVRAVTAYTGLSRSEIYKRMAAGTFPKSYPLSRALTTWSYRAVQRWIRETKAAIDAERDSVTTQHEAVQ